MLTYPLKLQKFFFSVWEKEKNWSINNRNFLNCSDLLFPEIQLVKKCNTKGIDGACFFQKRLLLQDQLIQKSQAHTSGRGDEDASQSSVLVKKHVSDFLFVMDKKLIGNLPAEGSFPIRISCNRTI